jgi:hypothetical protein
VNVTNNHITSNFFRLNQESSSFEISAELSFPAKGAEVVAIRQRGSAIRADVHGTGSFVWVDKGWVFFRKILDTLMVQSEFITQ